MQTVNVYTINHHGELEYKEHFTAQTLQSAWRKAFQWCVEGWGYNWKDLFIVEKTYSCLFLRSKKDVK